MADFTLKQNDLAPALIGTLKSAGGANKNLTGTTVVFKMGTSTGTLKVNQTITPFDLVGGVCRYQWQTGDTATAGTFFAEFEVTNADGTKETFPNEKPLTITIKADKL